MTEESRRFLPVFIGVVLTAILLGLLGYLANKRNKQLAAAPHVEFISPMNGSSVEQPVRLRFKSTVPIVLHSMGWMAGNRHLHAWVNDTQYMPAAADIRTVGNNEYEWTLPTLPAGQGTRLRLAWADMSHRPLPEGASQEIVVDIR